MAWIAKRLGVRPPEHRIKRHGDALVPLRDGVRLRTRRLGPADGGKHPTLLIRTPYGIGWGRMPISPLIAGFFARRGYNVLLQDTRGRYASGGSFYPLRPEQADGRDTLDWIASQPWFDGSLGMWGPSYLGYTQYAVAEDPPPFLKALVPIVTSTDMYGMFYPGGAFSLLTALRWTAGNGDRKSVSAPERRVPAAARTRPVRDAMRAYGRPAAFFDDWVDHPLRDTYWADIDLLGVRQGHRVPTLVVAGTYDIFCGPQLEDYAAFGDAAWLELGPTAHGPYALSRRKLGWRNAGLIASMAGTIRFLDEQLQGRAAQRDRVRRYVIGEDRLVEHPAWPPPDARAERLFLRGGGGLDPERPGRDEPTSHYVYDPEDPVPTRGGTVLGSRAGPDDQRPLASRPDLLVFDTPPLERTLALAGPVRLRLHASTDAPATDFTAKLVHVPADSRRPAINLCEGIARLDRPHPEGGPVLIDLWHASASIPPGDRLRLEVSSSNFPRFDAHPNLPGNPGLAEKAQPARQTVHHAADAPSHLELYLLR